MKITELIEAAEKVLEEHGDLPVVVPDAGCGCCRSYEYDPADVEVRKDVPSYVEGFNTVKLPLAFVVN
ncbi:hypothetical protein [Streptomyces werraensis]|uniref:hypothetical protein n=1 Tax=Streptomyces werraensis TaxID=68284 RepID=UPI003701572F